MSSDASEKARVSDRAIVYNQVAQAKSVRLKIVGGGPDKLNGELIAVDHDACRQLPPVGAVLEHELLVSSLQVRGRVAVLRAVRAALEEARSALLLGRHRQCRSRKPGEPVA